MTETVVEGVKSESEIESESEIQSAKFGSTYTRSWIKLWDDGNFYPNYFDLKLDKEKMTFKLVECMLGDGSGIGPSISIGKYKNNLDGIDLYDIKSYSKKSWEYDYFPDKYIIDFNSYNKHTIINNLIKRINIDPTKSTKHSWICRNQKSYKILYVKNSVSIVIDSLTGQINVPKTWESTVRF